MSINDRSDPLGVKSTLARGYELPGHAERSKDVVPKAGVGAPLDLQDKRSKGGICPAWLGIIALSGG